MVLQNLHDAGPDPALQPVPPDCVRQLLADRNSDPEIARVVRGIKKRKTVNRQSFSFHDRDKFAYFFVSARFFDMRTACVFGGRVYTASRFLPFALRRLITFLPLAELIRFLKPCDRFCLRLLFCAVVSDIVLLLRVF